jgi:hypothetical protein
MRCTPALDHLMVISLLHNFRNVDRLRSTDHFDVRLRVPTAHISVFPDALLVNSIKNYLSWHGVVDDPAQGYQQKVVIYAHSVTSDDVTAQGCSRTMSLAFAKLATASEYAQVPAQ